jgi:hypothetical protein
MIKILIFLAGVVVGWLLSTRERGSESWNDKYGGEY